MKELKKKKRRRVTKIKRWNRIVVVLKTHWQLIIISSTLYVSLYSLAVTDYNLNKTAVYMERTSVENLIANGELEAALRRYRYASLMKLRNRPHFLIPVITWIGLWHTRPNKDALWQLIRSALNQHAYNYIEYGFPGNKGGPYRSDDTPGTPDKYLFINLAYADLRNIKLSGCDFTLVDLYHADLSGADLRGADFSKAFLLETNLTNCNLGSATDDASFLTRLDISDDNKKLFDIVKSQLSYRKMKNISECRRYHVNSIQIDSWTNQLKSDNWQVRYIALFCINELPDSEITIDVQNALVELIERELVKDINGKKIVKVENQKTTDLEQIVITPYDRYVELLLIACARTKSDRVTAMLVGLNCEEYQVLVNTLVNIGASAIDPLLEVLKYGPPELRKSAAWVLGNMLWKGQANYLADEKVRSKIVEGLYISFQHNAHPVDSLAEWDEVQAEYAEYYFEGEPIKNQNWFQERTEDKYWIRRYIIRAFSMVEDSIAVPILEEISRSDRYTEIDKNGRIIYPVRIQVQQVIEQFVAKEKHN